MTGKKTQTLVLREILSRSTGLPCTRFEFPDYSSPIGKIIGAMLDAKPFDMDGYWHSDRGRAGEFVAFASDRLRGGPWLDAVSKTGNEMAFHTLLTADFFLAQEKIAAALSKGHVICDRYADVEDIVFAPLDCKSHVRRFMSEDDYGDEEVYASIVRWVCESRKFMHRSNHIIVLDSTGHAREGEIQDINERDGEFQTQVRRNYTKQARYWGWQLVDCDPLWDGDLRTSVENVACAVCRALNDDGFRFEWCGQLVRECVDAVLETGERKVA